MKELQLKFDHFLHTEDGDLMVQLGISAITASAIIISIWYLL
jgi:hypothetical protein